MDLIMQRGDVVVCVLKGDFGKPRPAVVVQTNLFNATHASITLCPVTTHLIKAPLLRLSLEPKASNGLKHASQIMVDKITTLHREKIHKKIGTLTKEQIDRLDDALKMWLALS